MGIGPEETEPKNPIEPRKTKPEGLKSDFRLSIEIQAAKKSIRKEIRGEKERGSQ